MRGEIDSREGDGISRAVDGGMGHVTVTLNGRTYRLRCGDGEEQRLFALADHVREKVDGLVREFGQVGEDRLLLMAALLVADEVFDYRQQRAAADGSSAGDARAARAARPQRKADAGETPLLDAGPDAVLSRKGAA